MVMAYPICCKCCKRAKDKHHVDNISRRRLDYVEEGYSKTCWESFVLLLSRFCWYFLSLVFFALTIVNIGASFEQCKAQVNLAAAWEKLYPDNYRTGVMCAWDKNGPPGPNSDIKTFLTVKDVEDANYEIIHCGACGDCSNWNDIQLQYTSRKVLAGITQTCARRSSFKKVNVSDTNDEIVQCNAQLVGFTIPCSKAWAWDEVHTKGLATFTFLQAQTNNAFADMEVTFQDITMATIDESLSGPTFVPWVGATRRRMNIISDIRRPDYQQCTVATQNWTEVFNDTFYPPVGGTYVVQPPGKPSETIVVIGQDAVDNLA
jgi:hypothetical protein